MTDLYSRIFNCDRKILSTIQRRFSVVQKHLFDLAVLVWLEVCSVLKVTIEKHFERRVECAVVTLLTTRKACNWLCNFKMITRIPLVS